MLSFFFLHCHPYWLLNWRRFSSMVLAMLGHHHYLQLSEIFTVDYIKTQNCICARQNARLLITNTEPQMMFGGRWWTKSRPANCCHVTPRWLRSHSSVTKGNSLWHDQPSTRISGFWSFLVFRTLDNGLCTASCKVRGHKEIHRHT